MFNICQACFCPLGFYLNNHRQVLPTCCSDSRFQSVDKIRLGVRLDRIKSYQSCWIVILHLKPQLLTIIPQVSWIPCQKPVWHCICDSYSIDELSDVFFQVLKARWLNLKKCHLWFKYWTRIHLSLAGVLICRWITRRIVLQLLKVGQWGQHFFTFKIMFFWRICFGKP